MRVAGIRQIWKSKHPSGFAGLAFEHLRDPLRRFLLSRLRHAQHAEDLEQEVYVRLLRLSNEQLVRQPEAYVFRIAGNLVSQFIRRQRQGLVDFDSTQLDDQASTLDDEAPSPEADYDDQNREERLARIVRALPPMQKAVFVLARYEDRSHAEIAARLGISVHTVKKHMLRAIHHCREELRES